MKKTLFPALGLLVLCSSEGFSQCSDAGVCSIGYSAPESRHTVSVSYTFGSSGSPDSLTFHSIDLSGSFRLFENSVLSVKLPYNVQSGPLGSVGGIGDLTMLWEQRVLAEYGLSLRAMAGVKIAIGSVSDGTLPQKYQSGLGTNDLLAGLTLDLDSWSFSAAYQIAGGRSGNAVDRLNRGDDLLLRAGYRTEFSDISAHGEVLFIHRVQESTILASPPGQPEVFANVPGSDQTQVNLLARAVTPIGNTVSLHGLIAVPLLQRTINLDGLKRALTLSAGLFFSL